MCASLEVVPRKLWLFGCEKDHFIQQDFYSSELKSNYSHHSQTTVRYILHGADYHGQSPREVTHFTVLEIRED